MRRLNFTRPGRVAKVSGKRLGDIGRFKMKRSREKRKRRIYMDNESAKWYDSNHQLTVTVNAITTLLTIDGWAKPIIVISVGDILKIDNEEIEVTKIKGNKYTVNRAFNGTKPFQHNSGSTVYIDHP